MKLPFQSTFLFCLSFAFFPIAIQAVDFEKEILPILQENCIDCHGPEKQKSEFRVDQRPIMMSGGDSGIASLVPGEPLKSYLIEVIDGSDPDMLMPPKGDPLTKGEVALISKWIEEGANWPGQMDAVIETKIDHWSFLPIKKPGEPKTDASSPIDGFLLEKLAATKIEPNPQANARSLIQRASITLTGLPPKPERVEKFASDFGKDADGAYAALVDELLASEHFGERWAQHWLDVIRWAETNGSEANLYRKNAWVYRDYVIRAFNEDIPYHQFVREQLAGDQFGVGEATGFLVAGPHVPAATVGREPSAIRQARADRMDEIMQTVGASMLGMTVSCARCHNHKFDPISIQDYYSLTAVFQGVEFGGRWPEYGEDHPLQQRAKELRSKMFKDRSSLRAEVGQWMEDWGGYAEFHFPKTETKALRIEFAKPNFGIDELQVYGPKDYSENLALASSGTKLVADDKLTKAGNPVSTANDGVFGTMAWRTSVPKGSKELPWVEVHFEESHEVNKFRFSSNREYFFETDYLEKKSKFFAPGFKISALQADGSWKEVGKTGWAKALLQKSDVAKKAHAQLQENIALLSEEGPRHSFVGAFTKKPSVTQVLHRGSPENPRDEVMPAGFAIMNGDLGLTSATPDPQRRAKFAEWVVNEENPLTARVMVNRIWHHIFGTGIVPTPSDFGKAGALPTHPELLDWLAVDFVKNEWSMKKMIRQIVLTDAFRRSSLPDEAKLNADAGSLLLWRFPPQRVSAEVIRDGILQASGKLSPEIGGRSFRIHNVKKTYAQWEVVNNYGPETWRRMIYQERMRRVDDKIFTAFDFPDCGQVRAKRPVSTTPLQALNLMNSDFVVEQAKLIAERAKADSPDAPVERMFELVLARAPSAAELETCKKITKANGLEIVARSLMNSNEFAFMP
ncbi:PSD1 and planctomycete cytochrome C domain-containing protein [Verrucomicrobiales bacterium]|nr:PSD1 and planctomycete cytochrome C domain-containing protein [Verrucomicrobiales bacterium]MDC0275671.1 PSD1 and planctomycete cytochrome C domain-containing protein [Verrucomicrobiales bacterium]